LDVCLDFAGQPGQRNAPKLRLVQRSTGRPSCGERRDASCSTGGPDRRPSLSAARRPRPHIRPLRWVQRSPLAAPQP
jgi:hypothetical protein